MQPFRYDPRRTDPKKIAAADIDEFLIERILDHRPKTKRPKRSELEFLVQWDGYDATHNSWEPWELLRNNSIVHSYCSANKMRSIVPKNIRESDSSD